MEWFYKGKNINVDEQGLFSYEHDGKRYNNDTLSGAKYWIDEQMKDYYNITKNDVKTLLNKLNDRERTFITTVLNELKNHEYNAYCELGVNMDFKYEIE